MTSLHFAVLNDEIFNWSSTRWSYYTSRPVMELTMYSKNQFYALEAMCHQRAAVARKEMEYWLNEAEEWTQALDMAASGPTLRAAALSPGKIDGSQFTEMDNPPRFNSPSLVKQR
jgi:hypothetical protein